MGSLGRIINLELLGTENKTQWRKVKQMRKKALNAAKTAKYVNGFIFAQTQPLVTVTTVATYLAIITRYQYNM